MPDMRKILDDLEKEFYQLFLNSGLKQFTRTKTRFAWFPVRHKYYDRDALKWQYKNLIWFRKILIVQTQVEGMRWRTMGVYPYDEGLLAVLRS